MKSTSQTNDMIYMILFATKAESTNEEQDCFSINKYNIINIG